MPGGVAGVPSRMEAPYADGIMGVPETFVIDKPLRGAVAPRGLQLE